MAHTDPLASPFAIGPLGPADIDGCLSLVREAGWNQIQADWDHMLVQGHGFGIRDENASLVATAVALPYPPSVGWIGMVLVAGAFRNRGFATRLLKHAIEELKSQGLTPMLDATPAGRKVYEPLGFVPVFTISRWRGVASGRPQADRRDPFDIDAAGAMDRQVFGASRRALLADLRARNDGIVLTSAERPGFLLSRAGRTAFHLGPVVAEDEADAVALCSRALDQIAGPVLIDVPDCQTAIADLLRARGFSVERPFTRMALSEGSEIRNGAAMRVIAGPELG